MDKNSAEYDSIWNKIRVYKQSLNNKKRKSIVHAAKHPAFAMRNFEPTQLSRRRMWGNRGRHRRRVWNWFGNDLILARDISQTSAPEFRSTNNNNIWCIEFPLLRSYNFYKHIRNLFETRFETVFETGVWNWASKLRFEIGVWNWFETDFKFGLKLVLFKPPKKFICI